MPSGYQQRKSHGDILFQGVIAETLSDCFLLSCICMMFLAYFASGIVQFNLYTDQMSLLIFRDENEVATSKLF